MHSAFILTELRYPAMPLAGQLEHKRFVHPGPLVLRASPLKSPTPTTDRDRTVSRRSEPSSRTALIGEQPNPWELLHPQDAMSRHRGAKPERRCELLTPIRLLSPAYLLSVVSRRSAFERFLAFSFLRAIDRGMMASQLIVVVGIFLSFGPRRPARTARPSQGSGFPTLGVLMVRDAKGRPVPAV